MRRPTRTRRLSIAAIVSLLAFVVVAAIAIRSRWTWDEWDFGNYGRVVIVERGCFHYKHYLPSTGYTGLTRHMSGELRMRLSILDFLNFSYHVEFARTPSGPQQLFVLSTPTWPLLLLLLIVPVRWLIARPASAPAFPVVTDATQA